MIPYEFGYWGLRFICMRSDVFWRAGVMGFMSGLATCFLRLTINNTGMASRVDDFKGLASLWGGWTFILSFLLVFKTQIAYSRYMEGISLLQQIFGVWLNATSNLLAFSSVQASSTTEQIEKSRKFKHLLVRLMSLLHWTALTEIAIMEEENFSVIEIHDLGKESLKYLSKSQDRMEVVMQWVQHLICEHQKNGVLWIPPPILSRVFQELSNGIVFVHDAIKITEYPFPYPYAQITTIMLIAYSCSLPLVFAVSLNAPFTAAGLAFAIIFSQWSMNYIAAEIEMPFGDDPNDLEIRSIAETFNRKLKALMHPSSSRVPDFEYDPLKHDILGVEFMTSVSDGTGSATVSKGLNSMVSVLFDTPRQKRKSKHVRRYASRYDPRPYRSSTSDISNGSGLSKSAIWDDVTASDRLVFSPLDSAAPLQFDAADEGPRRSATAQTPKADSIYIPQSNGNGAHQAMHDGIYDGTLYTEPVYGEITPGSESLKPEEGVEPIPWSACEGLVEHL